LLSFVFLIVIFELFSAHYFYSGQVVTSTGVEIVSRKTFLYPYFSDDWVGVALVKEAIANKSLPAQNPFDGYYRYFPNIFIVFFSFSAEIILLLNISPLSVFPILAIFFGVLISFLVYLGLRSGCKAGDKTRDIFFASLGMLLVPFITVGSNVSGIWNFTPFIMGLVLFLIFIISLNLKENYLLFPAGFLALLFYPPLIVFILPLMGAYLLFDKKNENRYRFWNIFFCFFALILIVLSVIFIQKENQTGLLSILYDSFWRVNRGSGLTTRWPWLLVPPLILPFSIYGLFVAYRKKYFYLLSAFFISVFFWIFYFFERRHYFIIDSGRVVVIASFFLIYLAVLGAKYLFIVLKNKYPAIFREKLNILLALIVLIIFAILSFSYTSRENWAKIVLKMDNNGREKVLTPNPPASDYLQPDDLRFFSEFSKKRFISPAWKGLVIGAATGNYPLESKASIVNNYFLPYERFMGSNCMEKIRLARQHYAEYVYSSPFSCPEFIEIGVSAENLHLYRTIIVGGAKNY